MNHSPAYFDAMFSASDDPWQFKTRWYEKRKRAMTLAALPAQRYARGYEPGCANGELAAALAERCDHLLASDGSSQAVALARCRLAGHAHVEVRQAWVPQDWPEGVFNLIVFSELGYFLNRPHLHLLMDKMRGALAPGGTLLACHWRHQADDCELNGDTVHQVLRTGLNLPLVAEVCDADFRIDVWSTDVESVAQHEGLV